MQTGEERINIFFPCQKLALQDTCFCFFFQLLKVFPDTQLFLGLSATKLTYTAPVLSYSYHFAIDTCMSVHASIAK